MNKLKLLALLTLWIVKARADVVPEIMSIEIDVLWNPTSLNKSIQAVVGPESTSGATYPALVIHQHFDTVARSTSTTTLSSSKASGMFWTGYSSLAGSAVTAASSPSMWSTMSANSSVWTKPTVTPQPSSTPFTGQGSLKEVSRRMIFLIFSYYYFRGRL